MWSGAVGYVFSPVITVGDFSLSYLLPAMEVLCTQEVLNTCYLFFLQSPLLPCSFPCSS